MAGQTVVLVSAVRRRLAGGLVLLPSLLAACGSGAKDPKAFVGVWRSSRTHTPLHIHENGEWEIVGADGSVLQFGVWQYDGKAILWSYRAGGTTQHDRNPVVSVAPGEFSLREQSGDVTRFVRLP